MSIFDGKWLTRRHVDYGKNAANYYQKNPTIKYFKKFNLAQVKQTKLRICALGYYVAYVNGKLVTQDVLNNEWTYYSKCKYFDEYDVTNLIHIGENKVEIELGSGMYNPFPLLFFAKHNLREGIKDTGEPKFILNLLADDKVLLTTDRTWKAVTGNRIFNNLYMGEYVDSHYQGQKIQIKTISLSQHDLSSFKKSFIPKVREFDSLPVKNMSESSKSLIVDFGETISGFLKIKINSKDTKKVIFRYCETKKDGKLDYATSFAGGIGAIEGVSGGPGAPKKIYEEDRLAVYPGTTDFKNEFTYHSFRYIEILGLSPREIVDIFAIPVHTNLARISDVKTNDKFLNTLYHVGVTTRLNNVHGIFEDCARERLQYGGDIVELLTSMLFTFDLSRFNRKVILDFVYGQTIAGGIPETAPYVGIESQGTGRGEGPLLWQLVLPYMLYKDYQFYEDKSWLNTYYSTIKKQYEYLMSWNLSDLAQRCIGDHGSPIITGFYDSTPDKIFVGYCTILMFNELKLKINHILGKETINLSNENKAIRKRIEKLYLNNDGSFGQGTQTSYAFALALNLGDRKKLERGLVQKIKENRKLFNCGIFGQSLLYTELHKMGEDSIVYDWLIQGSEVGFKSMLKSGDQVLKEKLRNNETSDSANHAMFASYLKWYYEALGGICVDEYAEGFDKIKINPYLTPKISNINTSLNTIHGLIKTSTKFEDSVFLYQVKLPRKIKYTVSDKLKKSECQKIVKNKEVILKFKI
ncbi:family 78 glycoside hydrolase catalytic domain [Lactobacillus isalae]|uniref:family 78 glycoside hydrolase catalytic domain n=1 Tax=Lactobacillus isalae TaxID=2993455 RepID=UPI0024A96C6F|nr:family 78 glycoside hydrolase catalytic domain [Lactobacillus isalae]